ncbi:hypothetical protein ACFY3U_21755 [Micromonospora sp. NPDC000089]|uniref:hypothetical protein n=1 Tax=unclassified Micromonospora TaxID=2617518 RepID=UPI0036C7E51B
MSSRIVEELAGLEQDVAALRLAPAAAVRARGRARSRRRTATLTGAAAAMAVAGTALPGMIGNGMPAEPPSQVAAAPSPACTREPTPLKARRPPVPAPAVPSAGASSSSVGGQRPAGKQITAHVNLTAQATDEQRIRIEATLRESGVKDLLVAVNHAGVCDDADLTAIPPERLPQVLVAYLDDPGDFARVDRAVRDLPGVDEVLLIQG